MVMVKQITSFSRNGLLDWLYQRISAIVLGIYFVFLAYFIVSHPNLTFGQWHGLFDNLAMKIATLLALIAFLVHTWIGLWTITTDYITERMMGDKAIWIRLPVQVLYSVMLSVLVIWGIVILWGGH
jgi:succinate dehydrogenase / fumarate reductase membrane anchor subunit